MSHVKVKICGIKRQEDADLCRELGADFIGLIFHPKSPRFLSAEEAGDIATGDMLRVGVFVSLELKDLRTMMDTAALDLVQAAGDQSPNFCRAIGPEKVMKVFWPERYDERSELEREIARYEGAMRYALLDAGKSGGGHGRSLAFDSLHGIDCPVPWLLAGGLGPHNLSDALRCESFGVDLNSGLESAPGVKDHEKMRKAFQAMQEAKSDHDA